MVGPSIRRPPWLISLLQARFFVPCKFHGDGSKGECNMYCLDCTGEALCSYCISHHKDHPIVQTYVINSAKIVFLNERPQQRPGKGVSHICEVCGRSLPDAFRFCSLGCKLVGMKSDPELSFVVKQKTAREQVSQSDSEDSSSPAKLQKTSRWVHVNRSPVTPTSVSYRTFSRKGTPRRAPF